MQTHFTYLFAMDTPSYVFIRPMILVSLECIGFCQHNGINLVLMQSMVFKIQLFLIYTFQKVVALHVLHEGRKYSYRCTVMLARNCIHCVHSKKTTTLPDHWEWPPQHFSYTPQWISKLQFPTVQKSCKWLLLEKKTLPDHWEWPSQYFSYTPQWISKLQCLASFPTVQKSCKWLL